MKRKMKVVSLLLAVSLITTMVTACSSNNKNNSNPSNEANAGQATENTGKAALEPYEITMALPIFGAEPKDMAEVEAAINKITQSKINATVDILPISIGAYSQQMNLMFSGGEKLDLGFTFGSGGMYNAAAASGKLLQIDDLLKEYGQGITEAVGEQYVNVPKVNGKLYGVPIVDAYAKGTDYYLRKDLVDKHQIDVASIETLDDVENVLKTIKEKEPNIIPLGVSPGLGPVTSFADYDGLGDRLGVLPGYDNALKITNLFETEEYADKLCRVHKWFKAGYINKDAATTTVLPNAQIKAGRTFSAIYPSSPGQKEGIELEVGYELVRAELYPPHAATGSVMSGLWTIAQHSENPERAMMFLNLMYSDKDIANLLVWGIEGKHHIKISDTTADYPEGLDINTVGYNMKSFVWIMGNQRLSYLSKTDNPKLREIELGYEAQSIPSKAMGFLFDEGPVKNEGVALKNVIEQYAQSLETGTVDPEKRLKEFNDKLKAAGIEKYMAEKQKQLDTWASTK
ncbi:ABC transporter substrate-binding protein [Paenibacillus sp. LHD-38]|uniref:ABC transporter substrate-binding protein n=1 Tax=Paenibacillus sp. LHD-38 TaxID=3072143 RepID=UPI00280FF268|nr:ABC transporter substrate-binding protein [Paenibacillus sp. LHD-38]MDQ8734275.1 ABC transporter substrate-binding protein [Paenibacillus sp. LHD-38]